MLPKYYMYQSWLKRLLASTISGVVTLTFLEVFLRLVWMPPILDPAYKRHDVAWMMEYVDLNSYGYRDEEFSEDKPADVFRIYALGDSYTFGWLLADSELTYAEQLEEYYKGKTDKKIEVINAASPGYSLKEEVSRFVSEGKTLSPDMVILGLNHGDLDVLGNLRPHASIPIPLLRNVRFLQLFVTSILEPRVARANTRFFNQMAANPDSPEWQAVVEQLRMLTEDADSINAGVVLVFFPYINPAYPEGEYTLSELHVRLKNTADDLSIAYVDPLENYLAYPDKEKLVVNPIDAHPTEIAHDQVIRAFTEQFDLAGFVSSHSAHTVTRKTTSIKKNTDTLGKYSRIISIQSSESAVPWVYFESHPGREIQKFPLRDKSARQSPIYMDYYHTFQHKTRNIIGTSIEYTVVAREGSEGMITFPREIYGFSIAGIENIVGLYLEKTGGTAAAFIDPERVEIGSDEIHIEFDPQDIPFFVYRLNLAGAVKQINIASDGLISFSRTELLQKTVETGTNSVTFPVGADVLSFPEFTRKAGESYHYAFVNGTLTRVEEAGVGEEGVTVVFAHDVAEQDTVVFPVRIEYDVTGNETLRVTLE